MRIITLLLITGSMLMLSCRKLFFDGAESRREITLEGFHSIVISGIYNIVLVQDSTDQLVITGKNDISTISAFVNNDSLIIRDEKKMSINPEKNTLTIHFSTVEHIVTWDPVNVMNSGTIKSQNFYFDALGEIANIKLKLDCRYFQLVNSANTLGNFYLKGKVLDCYLFNRYGCRIFADSLLCSTAAIINESVGDVRINASENIIAYINGPGNIFYYGTPSVNIAEKRGTGNVIRITE